MWNDSSPRSVTDLRCATPVTLKDATALAISNYVLTWNRWNEPPYVKICTCPWLAAPELSR